MLQQSTNKHLSQQALRRIQPLRRSGPAEQRQFAPAETHRSKESVALSPQGRPVNHNRCETFDTRQAAYGRYHGALGRYGGKVVFGKETPETLFALAVARGGSEMARARRLRMARLLR